MQLFISYFKLYSTTALVAFCSICYEMVIAQLMAIVYGNSYLRYCLTISFYLASLGLGALFVYGRSQHPLQKLLRLELLLAALGLLLPFYLLGTRAFLISALDSQLPLALGISESLGYLMVITIGMLSGMEIPLLLQMANSSKRQEKRILACDYLFTFIGAIWLPLMAFSGYSLALLTAVTACLNLLAIVWWLSHGSRSIRSCWAFLAFLGILNIAYAQDLTNKLSYLLIK